MSHHYEAEDQSNDQQAKTEQQWVIVSDCHYRAPGEICRIRRTVHSNGSR
jgi:hypothetical protein